MTRHEEDGEHSGVGERAHNLRRPVCEEKPGHDDHLVPQPSVLSPESAGEKRSQQAHEGRREVRRRRRRQVRGAGAAVEQVPYEAERVEDCAGLEVAGVKHRGHGVSRLGPGDLRCAVWRVAPLWVWWRRAGGMQDRERMHCHGG